MPVNSNRRIRIVYVTTVPLSARTLLRGQLRYLRERGFDVILVCSPGEGLEAFVRSEGVRHFTVPMRRDISPLRDLASLWRLFRLLRELKPDIVNASTPKASLLGTLAAWLARVPVRVYTLRGLRLETVTGPKRHLLALTERLTAACASRIVCVSDSLRRVCVEMNLVSEAKSLVLGKGSSNGIDTERFMATDAMLEESRELRIRLGLVEDTPVIGFVGRLTRDKGIVDLFDAYEEILRGFPDTRLLLLGGFEAEDPIPPSYRRRLESHPQVILAGFVSNTAPFYHLMDLLVFPSYREGLPNVVLEAAMAGVPTVGFRATGTTDAVVDGVTGELVTPGDGHALAESIAGLLGDPASREKLGEAARDRARRDFASERVWSEWLEFYERELIVSGWYGEDMNK